MSKYIYAMHGDCPKDVLMKGWIVTTHELGHDPNNHSGYDFSDWQGVIARLNNGYYPNGTIPQKEYYDNFATRCANFVRASIGCHIWIIGNEPNHGQERPNNQIIKADDYKECYTKCRNKIHALPGHESDLVLVAAIAPWNIKTGDWLEYFEQILTVSVDGIALHTYTHGASPDLITSEQKMNAPYEDRHYHFRAYLDFINRIPENLRHVPLFITETNQNDEWLNENNGWIQAAYDEINRYNEENEQKIRCLALYRWQYDKWAIKDKPEVIEGFKEAQNENYQWEKNGMNTIFEDGFEGDFYYATDPYELKIDSHLEVPKGWVVDWVQGTEPGVNHRPEYKPRNKQEGQTEVYEGNKAVGIHTSDASHDGVMYRRFTVKPGAKVKASCWAMGKGEGAHGMVVGIDVFGGTNFKTLPNDAWGEWWSTDVSDWTEGAWAKIYKETVAQASTITVFLRTTARYSNSNAAHFDSFILESDLEGEPPTPPTNGDLSDMLASLKDSANMLIDDIEAIESFVETGAIKALPV